MDAASPAPHAVVAPSEVPQGERSETGGAGEGATTASPPARGRRPDPEVPPKAKRRRFGAEYKLRILRLADGLTEPGEVGELLRREGLYSSHLSSWRRQRTRGELAGLTPSKRGGKAKPQDPLARENQRLRREVDGLREQLRKAETIIGVQKKLSTLLGVMPPSQGESGRVG